MCIRDRISADLGQQLEGFVAQLVAAGRYNSKSEVLREGVREVRAHTRAAPRDQRSSPVQHCGRHARIVSCARCARRIAWSWPGR